MSFIYWSAKVLQNVYRQRTSLAYHLHNQHHHYNPHTISGFKSTRNSQYTVLYRNNIFALNTWAFKLAAKINMVFFPLRYKEPTGKSYCYKYFHTALIKYYCTDLTISVV